MSRYKEEIGIANNRIEELKKKKQTLDWEKYYIDLELKELNERVEIMNTINTGLNRLEGLNSLEGLEEINNLEELKQ